jgi:glucuronate isomerase
VIEETSFFLVFAFAKKYKIELSSSSNIAKIFFNRYGGSFHKHKRFSVVLSDDRHKSLEEILNEHLPGNPSSSPNQEALLSQEVRGKMEEASHSFGLLMKIHEQLTRVYRDLMNKSYSRK